jgi:predicted transposase YdaD
MMVVKTFKQEEENLFFQKGQALGRIKGRMEGRAQGIEEGRLAGIEEGMIEGILKGKDENRWDIAINLKEQGFDIKLIAKITEVAIEDIKEMKVTRRN